MEEDQVGREWLRTTKPTTHPYNLKNMTGRVWSSWSHLCETVYIEGGAHRPLNFHARRWKAGSCNRGRRRRSLKSDMLDP